MDEAAITQYITTTFPHVETSTAGGYMFFFYGADRMMPFVTLATQDDPYDRASNLDRPDVFRLNIGVRRETYRALFGPLPSHPEAGGVVATGHDFTVLDQLMPHPIYAPHAWVCILNPSPLTFEQTIQPLLAEAYAQAARRQAKRDKGSPDETP